MYFPQHSYHWLFYLLLFLITRKHSEHFVALVNKRLVGNCFMLLPLIQQSPSLLIVEFYLSCKINHTNSSQSGWCKSSATVLICAEVDTKKSVRMYSGVELSSVVPVLPSCDHCSLVSMFKCNAVKAAGFVFIELVLWTERLTETEGRMTQHQSHLVTLTSGNTFCESNPVPKMRIYGKSVDNLQKANDSLCYFYLRYF